MHISIGCMCKDEGKLIVTSALPLCLPGVPTSLLPHSPTNLTINHGYMACPVNDGYRFRLLGIQ